MSRFSRINTIWRKELIDTLRDRRTVIAMVLVPMVLYPAMIIGLAQGKAIQSGMLRDEEYLVAVASDAEREWLVNVIGSDPARRDAAAKTGADGAPSSRPQKSAEELVAEKSATRPAVKETDVEVAMLGKRGNGDDYFFDPPHLKVLVYPDVEEAVKAGVVQAGVWFNGPPPRRGASGSTPLVILTDNTNVRSEPAVLGLAGILDRLNDSLRDARLGPDWRRQVNPLVVRQKNVAPEERQTGFVLGQIIPLILIIMTITSAIYPAIDLTAGERERGTLETLMVAPVPTVDLIAGKFIVVTLIGLLGAMLNLISIGGTVYLGGLGELLAPGGEVKLPLDALPWVLLMLVPLAVMFSAMLLAVCSFARSFKEAQNYIVPVMMAALIPGVVGILPATQFEGPIKIMPVANIVVLTRELFLGHFEGLFEKLLWVIGSTSLYAACAVAVAAKLFGQEAVLFSDAGSVKTIFQRRFFRVTERPSIAAALLLVVIAYSLNFFIQGAIGGDPTIQSGLPYLRALAFTLVMLLAVLPWMACMYTRVHVKSAFSFHWPDGRGLVAGLLFGLSTWILVSAWVVLQAEYMPFAPEMLRAYEQRLKFIDELNPWTVAFFLALVPGLCEELFFRGYVLSGVQSNLRKAGAVFVVGLAFALFHNNVYQLVSHTALGMLFAYLVIQYRSIWPAMLAHVLHNGLTIFSGHPAGLQEWLGGQGFSDTTGPPAIWVAGAAILAGVGLLLCVMAPRTDSTETREIAAIPSLNERPA